jgi:hypothetical protein
MGKRFEGDHTLEPRFEAKEYKFINLVQGSRDGNYSTGDFSQWNTGGSTRFQFDWNLFYFTLQARICTAK